MQVWEVSEIYSKWVAGCHIKFGVAGLEAQQYFDWVVKEITDLYSDFKKRKSVRIEAIPGTWDDKIKKVEVPIWDPDMHIPIVKKMKNPNSFLLFRK